MIIRLEKDIVLYIEENPKVIEDPKFINSMNVLLNISYQKHHLLLIDKEVSDFLLVKLGSKLDYTCKGELVSIAKTELGADKVFLRKMPHHIFISFDPNIKEGTYKTLSNPYHSSGKRYMINFFSLNDYLFIGSHFNIISEDDTDLEFYVKLRDMYFERNYHNHAKTNTHLLNGRGTNLRECINDAIKRKAKFIVICDTDKKTPSCTIETHSTYNLAHQAFLTSRKNTISDFLELDFHEKENLIPVSWVNQYSQSSPACERTLALESSQYNDRLLYFDYKEGLKKGHLIQNPRLFSYYKPVLDHLDISITNFENEDFIFSRIPEGSWEQASKHALREKNLDDFPDYLNSIIVSIGLNLTSWTIGGRTRTV